MKVTVHPETNVTVYGLMSTRLYHDHPQVFDVLENMVLATLIPIVTFVVVVVATTATVVQLKRVIDWRQKASANVDGTEVWSYLGLLVVAVVVVDDVVVAATAVVGAAVIVVIAVVVVATAVVYVLSWWW